jgi:hypothetical protein
MSYRWLWVLLLTALVGPWSLLAGIASGQVGTAVRGHAKAILDRLPAQAKTKPAAEQPNANTLSLEVMALRSLRTWQATPAQMKALQGLLKEDFIKQTKRQPAKASRKLVKNMQLLLTALIQDDEDDIKTYSEKVDVLRDEDEEIDDVVEVTPAAAVPAAKALRLFTPRQVLAYLKSFEDALPEPASVLLEALEDGRDATPEKWKKIREDAVAQVGWLLGGLTPKQPEKLAGEVQKWLNAHHKLKAEELSKQRGKLVEEINKEFTGRVSPNVILLNVAWHGMAELLCNPRLPAALAKRVKAGSAGAR